MGTATRCLVPETAWRWWKAGRLPVPAEQMPTGTVIVHPQATASEPVALYARVSSADQKSDLDRQHGEQCESSVKDSRRSSPAASAGARWWAGHSRAAIRTKS